MCSICKFVKKKGGDKCGSFLEEDRGIGVGNVGNEDGLYE